LPISSEDKDRLRAAAGKLPHEWHLAVVSALVGEGLEIKFDNASACADFGPGSIDEALAFLEKTRERMHQVRVQ
jgi:hypothetical protein